MTTRGITEKIKNRRVLVWSKKYDEYNLMFKTIDEDYKGIQDYVNHSIVRNKLVYTHIAISRFAAFSVMCGFAYLLGYELIKKEDKT